MQYLEMPEDKGDASSLDLESHMDVNQYAGAGNQSLVFYKSNKWS